VIAGLAERSVAIDWLLVDPHIKCGPGQQDLRLSGCRSGPTGPGVHTLPALRAAQAGAVVQRWWACRRRHRLHYRKQLIPPLAVKRERFEHLHQAIGRGRSREQPQFYAELGQAS